MHANIGNVIMKSDWLSVDGVDHSHSKARAGRTLWYRLQLPRLQKRKIIRSAVSINLAVVWASYENQFGPGSINNLEVGSWSEDCFCTTPLFLQVGDDTAAEAVRVYCVLLTRTLLFDNIASYNRVHLEEDEFCLDFHGSNWLLFKFTNK